MTSMSVFQIAFVLFLIANPIGGVPLFVSLVKDFDFKRQKIILFRESVISMFLAYFFLFLGEPFLSATHIELYAVRLGGGLIVLLVAIDMIFPSRSEGMGSSTSLSKEPFIVPIATPLITGGGCFSNIMVFAKQEPVSKVALAIFIAWTATIVIVTSSVYLQKILGRRGLLALEQLMGMILMMIAIEMITLGLHGFGEAANVTIAKLLTT